MAKKEQSDREIEELLNQLRDKTLSDAQKDAEKPIKNKKMTDEDVKALLKKYYSDSDSLPSEKEPAFEFDTSDFEIETESSEKESESKVDEEVDPVSVETEPEPEADNVTKIDMCEAVLEEQAAEYKELVNEPLTEGETLGENAIEETVSKETQTEDEVVIEGEAKIEDEVIMENEAQTEDESFAEEVLPDQPVTEEETSKDAELEEEKVLNKETPENDAETAFDSVSDKETDLSTKACAPTPFSERCDEQEWKPYEDVSGRIDDNELDLMVALGFGDTLKKKYGDERVHRAEEKQRAASDQRKKDVTAYGYPSKEYTKTSDKAKIKEAFDRDRKKLIMRLIGTAVLVVIMFIYSNFKLFGIPVTGVFDIDLYPSVYVLISLGLLLACAAISYKQIFDGLVAAIGRKKNGNALLAVTTVVFVLYDIILAILAPADMVIYDFVAAEVILLGVVSEFIDYRRERTTFSALSESDENLYGLCKIEIDDRGKTVMSANKVSFIDGYFKQTSGSRKNVSVQLFVLVPVFASGALMAISAAIGGIGIGRSLSAIPAMFAFAAPFGWGLGVSLRFMKQAMLLKSKKSGIIGSSLGREYINTDRIIFDDAEAFPDGSAEILNIQLFDNFDIYQTIYNVSALFKEAGGPLKKAMEYTANDLGEPKSVSLTGAAEHYVEALVDCENKVCAGSLLALKQRGIYIPTNQSEQIEDSDFSVMYTAINGELCARFSVKYTLDKVFKKNAEALASEKISICIRTLDPNIDKAVLFKEFGENVDVGVVRRPQGEMKIGSSVTTSVFSRNGVLGVSETLMSGLKMAKHKHTMLVSLIIQLITGVLASVLLLIFGCPTTLLPLAATALQIVGILPFYMVCHLV